LPELPGRLEQGFQWSDSRRSGRWRCPVYCANRKRDIERSRLRGLQCDRRNDRDLEARRLSRYFIVADRQVQNVVDAVAVRCSAVDLVVAVCSAAIFAFGMTAPCESRTNPDNVTTST
jgi:hypothetical protein